MKNLKIALLGLIGLSHMISFAQGSVTPYSVTQTGEAYSQMWKLGSTYLTAYATYSVGQLGTQKDTTSGNTPLYLSVAAFNKYTCITCPTVTVNATAGVGRQVLNDTFTLASLSGTGTIEFTAAAWASTGTDTIAVTLEESPNGVDGWSTVTSVTGTATLYPTSGSTATMCNFYLPVKYSNYYRIKFVGKAGSTSRVQAWYHKYGNVQLTQQRN